MRTVGRPSPLRARRLLRGWSLYELQLATGIQEAELSLIERGRAPLKNSRLVRLATAYQTNADRLAAEQDRWLQQSRAGGERRPVRAIAPINDRAGGTP
jgi:transcriptional regulator with XRE-family HTH domain